MLTGKKLGAAISVAIDKKLANGSAKSKADIARYFGIEPPSIYDWINRGTVTKDKLPKIWDYFSDVVGLDHWGLDGAGNWPFKEISYDRFSKLPDVSKKEIEAIIISRCNEHLGAEKPSTTEKTAA